jgi:Protein of unknown function (DUF4058)
MPLRDHFHPPLSSIRSWDALHGQWPAMIVIDLNQRLPAAYSASPHIHLGTGFEVDVATFDEDRSSGFPVTRAADNPGATAVWSPPKPTLVVQIDEPQQDEYEVRIIESKQQRLVAAIEIISPANKDRPEHRRGFANKCAGMVQQGVSVTIVDLVTNRRGNLYAELLNQLGESDPGIATDPPMLYAVACRSRRDGEASYKFESWFENLSVNDPLPTLPLWLSTDLAVPLDLEKTYQETCRILRIA